MAAPGTSNNLGISSLASTNIPFESPVRKEGGSRFDMGMLALFLVSNWFVNGETVLIDGGVSQFLWTHVTYYWTNHPDFTYPPIRLLENVSLNCSVWRFVIVNIVKSLWNDSTTIQLPTIIVSNHASDYIYSKSHKLKLKLITPNDQGLFKFECGHHIWRRPSLCPGWQKGESQI